MERKILDKKITLVTVARHDGCDFKEIKSIVVRPETDIEKIKANSGKILKNLSKLVRLSPVQSLFQMTFDNGIKSKKRIDFKNESFQKDLDECLEFFKDFPEFKNIVEPLKKSIANNDFNQISLNILEDCHVSCSEGPKKKYILTHISREYGGAGCGGDCFDIGNPVLVEITEADYEKLSNLENVDYDTEDLSEFREQMHSKNYPKCVIESIEDIEDSFSDELFIRLDEFNGEDF